MVEDDLELERELGQATIVYDDPVEGTVNKTVPNEHIVYFQDHWMVKVEEDDEGNDILRRIPSRRVHYVERSVEEFEEEVKTVMDRVRSVADQLRSRILGGEEDERSEDHSIEVESNETPNPGDDP